MMQRDKSRLKQTFENQVNNLLKHMLSRIKFGMINTHKSLYDLQSLDILDLLIIVF